MNQVLLTDGTEVVVGSDGVEGIRFGDSYVGIDYDDGRTKLYPLHMVAFVESMDVNRAAVKGAVDRLMKERES